MTITFTGFLAFYPSTAPGMTDKRHLLLGTGAERKKQIRIPTWGLQDRTRKTQTKKTQNTGNTIYHGLAYEVAHKA